MRNVYLAALAAAALAACSSNESTPDAGAEPTKVGFIYVGPRGDYGWTKSHEDGRQYLENYGKNVKTLFVESVLPSDAPAKIDQLYATGAKIVFTTSFDFLDAALQAPERHSDLWMMNCAGFKTATRAGNYMGRIEEAEYLTGIVAGKMTKTNKIGMVGALRIYEQVMHINAFTLGVRSVNPNAQVYVRWVGDWFNPAMEKKATEDLIALDGVDIIKGLTDTATPNTTAEQIKTTQDASGNAIPVWTVGYDSKDSCLKAPESCLVSSYFNWGPYYVSVVEEIAAGKYPSAGRVDYLGTKDFDIVGISPMSDRVPAEVQELVRAKQKEIVEGRFNVFQGPFNYDDGTAWKAAGEKLSDEDLTCTKRFVQGAQTVDGPACQTDEQCKGDSQVAGKLTCDTTKKLCVAPDLSGCGK